MAELNTGDDGGKVEEVRSKNQIQSRFDRYG
jgi:hypothetical protein